MPFRTSVGAICETIPPAPMHRTWLRENISWSNPGILRWRSSAPGIAVPCNSIEVVEPINAGRIGLDSFSVDFKVKLLIEPNESNKPVTAEDRHERQMPGFFKAALEVFVCSRW